MMNPSAPTWLVDEVQATLKSLQSGLEDLKNSWISASSETLDNRLLSCQELAHSITGAFDIASWEPLSRYAGSLQKVMQFFRAEPTRLTSDSISLVQTAVWSLSDFLQTTNDKVPCTELSLYAQYQSLAQLLSITCHPMELWASVDQLSAIAHWTGLDVSQELLRHALNRKSLSAIEAADLHEQIDELMLGLVRHKSPECAAKLQSLCNWRLMLLITYWPVAYSFM
jgi:chemotaxis protein histidine kinase CheA